MKKGNCLDNWSVAKGITDSYYGVFIGMYATSNVERENYPCFALMMASEMNE
jgi:hypothetical protein